MTSIQRQSQRIRRLTTGHTGLEETNICKNVGVELILEITAGAVTRVAGHKLKPQL